jgi:uncharacterized membrane protein
MEKKKGMQFPLVLFVIALCLFVVFYSLIECKPNHVGFWFILVLGISIGVALTRFIQGSKH